MLSAAHVDRLKRARCALEGLSVGDALGGFFEGAPSWRLPFHIRHRQLPAGEWHFTDDTNMALSIYSILRRYGTINQDALARDFAHHFERHRGYGMGARNLLRRIQEDGNWKELAPAMFRNSGSYGNGAAMRIAPLGAYFADDIKLTIENARLSSEITHAHPEGIAGGVAVAVGAALAWQFRDKGEKPTREKFLESILPHVPESAVKKGVQEAVRLAAEKELKTVVEKLGNGSLISAQDTVPFVLWSAGGQLDNFEEAIWTTAAAGGDVDTTCAMVGGIVASYAGQESIPVEWLKRREPLPNWPFQEGTDFKDKKVE